MAITVGQQLKKARQDRGLTLEQVAQVTRIRVPYLQALENDQRDALPSAVQGKGFLRLYASHLNLPLPPLLDLWDGKVTETSSAVPSEPAHQPEPQQTASLEESETDLESPAVEFVPSKLDGAALPVEDQAVPSGSMDIFIEIGQKLRKQREALGLTRAEVERYTHLRQHYIQALEEGNPAGLPSPVQGRGLLSNYAAFLNLSEDELLLRYADALQVRRSERVRVQQPAPLFTSKKRPARQAPIWRRFLTPDLVFGVGLAAAILFFVLWTVLRITELRAAEIEPTPPAIAQMLLNAGVDATSTADLESTGLVLGGDEGGLAPAGEAEIQRTPLATIAPTRTPAPLSFAPINNDPLQIYIVARQRAWLRVITDDKVKFLGRVVPGNAYAFSASKQIELLTGNAAAIQVFYNQMDLGTLGGSAEVAGLVFNSEGILTPTAAFTPTATVTRIPTITPEPSATPQATPNVTPLIP
jgi:cytoskeleton protein RodZ